MTGPVAVEVDVDAAVPPYEQIRTQVAGHVAAGTLVPGDRLPTVRAMAADLGIATGTVARAYRELEAAGVVTSRRRTGTVVAGGPTEEAPAAPAGLRIAAERLAELAVLAGLSDAQAADLLRGALAAHRAGAHQANVTAS